MKTLLFNTNLRQSFFNLLIMGGALFYSLSAWAQPTVTVPSGCIVVVPGTGGSIMGGTVGNGGIITMPDPYSGGTFTLNPNGTIANTWNLLGDLSEEQTPPLIPGTDDPVQTIVGATADIMSYNKNVRNAEATPPSTPDLARSIGRVTIPYEDTVANCGNQIMFTVYKVYDDMQYIPPIIGPDCWLPDSIYTYSVDQIASDNLSDAIGLDNYYWTITDENGNTLNTDAYEWYTSADESSITLVAPEADSLFAPYTIRCCYGRANDWDGNDGGTHTTCVTKFIGVAPPVPDLEYPACLEAGASSVTVTNQNYVQGVTYTWHVPSNWGVIESNDEEIELAPDNNPGSVILSAVTNCDSVSATANINRSLSHLDSILGPTCVEAGSTHTYSVPNAPINTNLTWSLPNGWNNLSPNPSAQVVEIQVGNTSDTIFVWATNCPEPDTFLVVNVIPLAPDSLWGDTALVRCETDSLTYTITSVEGAEEYGWIFPTGWTPATLTTEDTAVNVAPDGQTSGLVQVYAIGCENSDTISIEVVYEPLLAPDSILIDASCINAGINVEVLDTVNFSIQTPGIGVEYAWQIIPANWNILSTADSDSTAIEVETDGQAGTYNVLAWAKDACGTSDTTSLEVVIDALSFSIDPQTAGSFLLLTSDPEPVVNGNYYWWYDNDNLLLDGVDETAYADFIANFEMPICLEVQSSITGCTTRYCLDQLPSFRKGLFTPNKQEEKMNLYPNPATSEINLGFESEVKGSRHIQLIDMQGRVLLTTESDLLNIRLNTSELASGTYFVVVTSKKTIASHKVVISK
jgi:hypothetical protein